MTHEKALQIFKYQENEVRHFLKDGQSWWVASDVCKILGLENVSLAVNGNMKTGDTGLDVDEKLLLGILISGQHRQTLLVNESGLYHLIFKSRKSEAQQFRRWVMSEVLPSIRKTGSYSIEQNVPQEPAPSFSDVLRQRAFLNEGRVPADLFSTQCELTRELHYVGDFLDATLDNEASLEASVGQCFSSYVRAVVPLPDAERCKYRHQLPSGRIVDAWAYPIGYLPHFRHWLYTVYFPVKFPAYQEHRSKRLGGHHVLKANKQKALLAARGVEQLSLF